MTQAWRTAAGLAAGLIFGFGLSLSGMVDPARVRAFLDVTGDWDASLAFVLLGAVAVSALGQALARRLKAPLFDTRFAWPRTRPVDRRLLAGSAIFGVGWGMSGLCPGPAVASLALGLAPTVVFAAAMLAGMLLHRLVPDEGGAAHPSAGPAA